MKDKIRKIVTIICFLSIIFIPLLSFEKPGRSSLVQNKVTATMPDLSKSSFFDKNTLTQVEQVIDDNIGFKDKATLAYIAANYKLFNRIAIQDYEMGVDENILFLPDNVIKNMQGLSAPTEEECTNIVELLNEITETANNLGSEFIFMPIPNKEMIYPEAVPDYFSYFPGKGFFDVLCDFIENNSHISVVNTKQYLLDYKKNLNGSDDVLYYKNIDATHWNSYGMYVGYLALMDTINDGERKLSVLTEDKVTIEKSRVQSALKWLQSSSKFLSNALSDLDDNIYSVYPVDGWSYINDNSTPSNFVFANDKQNRYFHLSNDTALNKATIFISGDSYIYSFMLPILSQTFSEVYFLSSNVCTNQEIGELLNLISPDYIVFERVERQTSYGSLNLRLQDLKVALLSKSYKECINNQTDLKIDIHFDDTQMEHTHQLSISEFESSGFISFSGWTADFSIMESSPAVMVELGDQILITSIVQRSDLQEEFYNGGFKISIPISFFENANEMKIYALTQNQDGVYDPMVVSIVP